MPKQNAIMTAVFRSLPFGVVPSARDTAKQSLERPMPIRAGGMISINFTHIYGWNDTCFEPAKKWETVGCQDRLPIIPFMRDELHVSRYSWS
jgi:hypothetical protein